MDIRKVTAVSAFVLCVLDCGGKNVQSLKHKHNCRVAWIS